MMMISKTNLLKRVLTLRLMIRELSKPLNQKSKKLIPMKRSSRMNNELKQFSKLSKKFQKS